MPLSLAQQRRAIKEFFESETRNLGDATRAVVRQSARQLKSTMAKQLRQNFRSSGSAQSKGFQRGVKIYDLESDLTRGPASYVRLGKIQSLYQEGATLRGEPNLIILLPEGERLGFKRISKGNPWRTVWEKWGRVLQLARVSDGTVVLYRFQGKLTPVYKIQASVTVPKRLTFFEEGEKLADEMPAAIAKLLDSTDA
jgi:hypothetical protein